MRAAIYARVSSAAQRDSHTIENQLRALPAFVAAEGWTLAGTYVDDGRSAKAGKLEARDGFAALVRDAEARKFDLLVVVDVDRLTRTDSIEERALILGPFQRLGIDIVTPSGGRLDMRTMLGELWITIQALGAAEENRKRAERIKAGKLRAIAEGRKPAGPTPYGLTYARATGTWSLDVARAEVVREIHRRVIAGESCMAIADDLHERAAPPPRGPWTRHKVWQLARSRHVLGEWSADKRRRLVIAVPRIIDDATWQAAQAKLIEHGKRGLLKTKHVYLLEGLAVCGVCGSPMAIRSATKHGTPAAYVCRARKLARRGEARCSAAIVQTADVDARVWARVETAITDPETASEVQRRSEARRANRRDWQSDVARYQARLKRLVTVEAGLLARWRTGAISDDAVDVELPALQRERTAITEQLKAATERATDAVSALEEAPLAWLDAMRDLAANGSPASRQRIVRTILEPPAVFDGYDVTLTLQVEEAYRPASAVFSVVEAGYRTHHGATMRIRVVA